MDQFKPGEAVTVVNGAYVWNNGDRSFVDSQAVGEVICHDCVVFEDIGFRDMVRIDYGARGKATVAPGRVRRVQL